MLCILLVDDNPDDRLLVTRELSRTLADVKVKPVANAQQLDQAMIEGGFDLVITDYQLCWSTGLAVLTLIKAFYPDCPVVMFTDSGNEEIAVEGMKSGLSDYVIKGKLRRLPIAVQESLEKHRLRQNYATAVGQLRTSEENLRFALEAADIVAYTWDILTGDFRCSENASKVMGEKLKPGIGRFEDLLALIHPEDREPFQFQLKATLDRTTQSSAYASEYRLLPADDTVIWVYDKGEITADPSGKPLRLSGILIDITNRKQLEAEQARSLQLEQTARAAAEAANRIKDEFLATLSHELRSPLNAIVGWSKILRSRQLDAATTARALETIERSARLQTQLIEDLLDISRIIRGKLSLTVAPVNLVTLIEATIETIRPAAVAKSIAIHWRASNPVGQLPITRAKVPSLLVLGDAGRLQQIVWNLLSNAVKFTPMGGRVEVRLAEIEHESTLAPLASSVSTESVNLPDLSEYAEITVSDTGKGIAKEFLPYVFDSFRQADASISRSHGGLGLGLAIVRNLVELHGGTVSAQSPGEGAGATFTVHLPLLKQATATEPAPKNGYAPSSLPLAGLRILVVDDELDTRELLTFVLEQHGAIAEAAASAEQALKAVAQSSFDLLLSDIGMPEQDGYTLMQKIRQLNNSSITAIALTAYAREEDRDRAIAAGFQQHMAKPIEPLELVSTIVELIQPVH